MAATRKETWGGQYYPVYEDDRNETRITECYFVDGKPAVAQADAALPAKGAAHGTLTDCFVVNRRITTRGEGSDSVAIITYSNAPERYVGTGSDDDPVLTLDMIGRTEKQMWDITDPTAAIGANNDGIEVYRPHHEIVYSRRESSIDSRMIRALTGTVNAREYKGCAAGTLLFLGARAERRGASVWRTEYHFLYNEDGHQASWRPYEDTDDPTNDNQQIRTYGAEETATVYAQGNFDRLPLDE
jgi:hypothetical protein